MQSLFVAGADFLHSVECAARFEPTDLQFVEGMIQPDVFRLAIVVGDATAQRLQ